MFSGVNAASSSPLAGLMQNNLVQNLMEKLNLNHANATNVASDLLPNVLNNLSEKVNDPNDSSFDLQNIISKVSGGIDIGSIVNQFTGSNSNGQTQSGGLFNTIKGLFGK